MPRKQKETVLYNQRLRIYVCYCENKSKLSLLTCFFFFCLYLKLVDKINQKAKMCFTV